MAAQTHQQLIEEWKEKFRREFPFAIIQWDEDGTSSDKMREISTFLEQLALAAAKGAVEAGRVALQEDKNCNRKYCDAKGFNAAISQSERQVREYFAGI